MALELLCLVLASVAVSVLIAIWAVLTKIEADTRLTRRWG
jgi:hypothetical protein